jgi:DNA invertase Pin-like site-specific DNA recombinase
LVRRQARRRFDLLLVWSLDRFSREGMAATIGHLLAILASLAKLEREKISQRTKAGLERARAMGKRLGRAKFSDGDRRRLRAALDTGDSWHAVSRATKIPYSTVKKHARLMGYEPRRAKAQENLNG